MLGCRVVNQKVTGSSPLAGWTAWSVLVELDPLQIKVAWSYVIPRIPRVTSDSGQWGCGRNWHIPKGDGGVANTSVLASWKDHGLVHDLDSGQRIWFWNLITLCKGKNGSWSLHWKRKYPLKFLWKLKIWEKYFYQVGIMTFIPTSNRLPVLGKWAERIPPHSLVPLPSPVFRESTVPRRRTTRTDSKRTFALGGWLAPYGVWFYMQAPCIKEIPGEYFYPSY